MALINCPECNKEISDKAETCIYCGYKLPKPEPKFQGVYCPSCLDSNIKTSVDVCPFCNIRRKDSIYGTAKECRDYGESSIKLKQSPDFNEKAYQHRINYVPIEYENSNSPKCPTCSSTNIRKMSEIERGASIATFGLFSKKINKTFKCNRCGYTW